MRPRLPPAAIEIICDMQENLKGKIERIKELEEEIKGYQSKMAYVEPTDDIQSEDSTTYLSNELTIANNALMEAQDEITALKNETERLEGLINERDEVIVTLEDENEELRQSNAKLFERLETYTDRLKKTKIYVRPARPADEEICPICLGDVSDSILLGSIMCYSSHGICVDCYNRLVIHDPDKILCPTCRFQWFDPDMTIWAPNNE